MDDYSPLRFKAVDIAASEATLFPIKDSWQYVERQPMGFGRKGFSGEEFYSADNHPSGAVFSYYLKDGLKTIKQNRQAAEKKAQKEGKNTPFPNIDKLRAEDEEEKPALIFTISDNEGNVVRKLSAPVSKGFHRLEWDYRSPSGAPITNAVTRGYYGPPTGYYNLPGTYTVSLAKRVGGETTNLSEPQSFVVKDLFKGIFDSKNHDVLSEDWKKIWDLRRAVQGASLSLGEVNSRIGFVMKALDEMTNSTEVQMSKLRSIKVQASNLQIVMNGDRTLSRIGKSVPMAILQRVNAIAGAQFNNFSDVTADHKKSFNIAREEFIEALADLKSITRDLGALERELDGIGPWTMGRLPDWNPN